MRIITILIATSLLVSLVKAEEIRTYAVILASVTDTTTLTSKGLKNKSQPLLNVKLVPIINSSKCSKLEIAYANTGEKNFLDVLEANGSMVLLEKSILSQYPDPRGGDLIIDRVSTFVQDVPSFCYDVAVSSK